MLSVSHNWYMLLSGTHQLWGTGNIFPLSVYFSFAFAMCDCFVKLFEVCKNEKLQTIIYTHQSLIIAHSKKRKKEKL